MSTNPDPTPPPGVNGADYVRYLERQQRHDDSKSARRSDGMSWEEVMEQMSKLPPLSPEEEAELQKQRAAVERNERLARFRRVCPPEFMQRIDRAQLTNPDAFDRVARWEGTFPGPLAHGVTGASKTRAAWSALARMNIDNGRPFAWFPVKRLMTEFARYESKDSADEFWRYYRGFSALLVDDIDKINWQFESEMSALFQFYDWVYRDNRPVITTTNKPRSWWADKMGDAFARRLFDEAHFEVKF